jgi:lipoprotein-anchoring transpeptidase ErfK/SrfK
VIDREGGTGLVALGAAALLVLAAASPAVAGEQPPKPPDPASAVPVPPTPDPNPLPPPAQPKLQLKVKGEKRGKVKVGKRVRVLGKMTPWRPDQEVTVAVERGKKKVRKRVVPVTRGDGHGGKFALKGPKLIKPGRYVATASLDGNTMLKDATARSRRFKIKYPSLRKGNRGKRVKLFNSLLDRQGYVPSNGKKFTDRTARAVLAYRKVNGMARITRATSGIFRKLADGRGTYKLRHPGAGKHVEASLRHQVFVLADGGKARRIYHTSSGAPGTPSDRGHFKFYRRQPGYNSLRMYYSVYYNRGEAVHGYSSVPTHPASHGCFRIPISDARYVYNWVSLGMSIYVY